MARRDDPIHLLVEFLRAQDRQNYCPTVDFFSVLTADIGNLQRAMAHGRMPFKISGEWQEGGEKFKIRLVQSFGHGDVVLYAEELYSPVESCTVAYKGENHILPQGMKALSTAIYDDIEATLPQLAKQRLFSEYFEGKSDAPPEPVGDDKEAAMAYASWQARRRQPAYA